MLKRDYLDKFIENNKPLLKYVYAIRVLEDDWLVNIAFADGKGFDLDTSPLRGHWENDWLLYPNTGVILEEVAAMRECGFLEEV